MAAGPPDLPLKKDAGVSLIETVVALAVFALVAAAAASMLMSGIGLSRDARNRTAAALVAGEAMEQARASSLASFTTLASSGTTTATFSRPNGITFSVQQTAVFVPKDAPSGACASTGQGGSAGVQPVLLVTETVTWPGMRTTRPVTTSTTLTPPIGTYADTTGGIDVKALGAANGRLPGISVTVTSTSGVSLSMTTDSAGCAYAAFLAPGAYIVRTATPGYVDSQEQPSSTLTVGVVSGQVAQAVFHVDRAVELDAVLTPAAYRGSTIPAVTGLPITVGNSGLAGTGSYSFSPGTTQLTPLYPYSSYGVWAGHCPEAYPAAVDAGNNRLYGSASTTTATPVTGQPTAVAVPLYPLEVTVTDSSGSTRYNGATVQITEQAGAASSSCSSLLTYGMPSSTRVGSTDGLSVAGAPLGRFTVTVSYGGNTQTRSVTVTPSGGAVQVTV